MISFKGAHFPKELMEERGVKVDHATLNRWVIDYSPLITARKCAVARSWRMNET